MKKVKFKTGVRCPCGKNKSIDRADKSNPGSSDESLRIAERSPTLPTHYYSIPTISQHKATISTHLSWKEATLQYLLHRIWWNYHILELCDIHWYHVFSLMSKIGFSDDERNRWFLFFSFLFVSVKSIYHCAAAAWWL